MRSTDNIWPPDIKKSPVEYHHESRNSNISDSLGFYGNNYLSLYHLCSSFEIISRVTVKMVTQRYRNIPVQHTGYWLAMMSPARVNMQSINN